MMFKIRFSGVVWVAGLIVAVMLVSVGVVYAEPGILDTPTTVVNETFNEWTLNEGLLYWANRCYGGEFRGDGYLRRRPANGGTTRTLSTVEAADCYTFLNMAADASGLYYFSWDAEAIYHRPVDTPYDPPTTVVSLTSTQAPASGSRLALDGDYIYWITDYILSSDDYLLRVRKDGAGGIETVAYPIPNPDDLVVVNGAVYWLDDNGLQSTTVSCGSLPCDKSQLASTRGDHLLYREGGGFWTMFRIYWTDDGDEIENIPERIKRYHCDWIPGIYPNPPTIDCETTILYTAPSLDWELGQLGTDGTNLFWIEGTEATADPQDGRLRRMPIGGGTAEDIAVNMPHAGERLFTDNLYVYFAQYADDMGLYRLPFDAAAIVRDLAADELEVTQGIQNLANEVPLVAQKTTYVRAYGREDDGPAAISAEAYLHGTRGGSPLPGSPLHTTNGTQALETGGSYDRVNVDESWLFRLPNSWTEEGTINLRVVVDPREIYDDPNRGNNEMSEDFTFNGKAPVCTVYVPVRTHSAKYSRPTENPNFWEMIDVTKRLWPAYDVWTYYQTSDVAELQVCWKWGFIPYPCFGPYELPSDTWKVLTSLNTRDFFSDDPDECDDRNAKTHYIGSVHPDANTGTTLGSAYLDDNVAWVKFAPHSPTSSSEPAWPDAGATLAHEMAHNHNRRHVDCGGPDNVDHGYPYPPDQIADVGQANHYGFDPKTLTAIAPDAAKDLMTYCRPYWTSDYTWQAIYNRLGNTRLNAQSAPPRLMAADGAVLVTGAITPSQNSGMMNYAWVYPTSSLSAGMLQKWEKVIADRFDSAAINDAPTYHLRLLDDGDNILTDYTISTIEMIDEDAPEPVYLFMATFSAPTTTVSLVELLEDYTVLDSREPGTTAPAVTIFKPEGGETFEDEMQLVWEGSDPDAGDDLLYNVQYSPDNGQTWLALLTDFASPEGTDTVTATLINLSIPGSESNQGLIRVAASDGYHTGLATSAPFTVTNREPEPYISSPTASEPVPAEQPVVLRGDANDAEDGGLSGDSLEWAINAQVQGTGEELLVNGLTPGEHEVTLTARDANAQEATAQTTLEISPLSIPVDTAPQFDGFCDDASYADGVQIQLAPYSDDAQATVHLLRSTDYLWACFSGMKQGSETPGAFAGLRVDANYSRDALAQADDYGFFVGEDGGYFTYAGDGAGGFDASGPGGLQAQISAYGSVWSAELRIEASVIDGWNHTIGMNLGHYWVNYQGDDYVWPYDTIWNEPDTWAETKLGELPRLSSISPISATVGDTDFILTVAGDYFVDGAVVRWDSANLPTGFSSSAELTATVGTANVASAGAVEITVRNPSSDTLDSNPATFMVYNPVPEISSLNPDSVEARSETFTMTVSGTNFVDGAAVLWNEDECTTTYVSDSELVAEVAASRVIQGQTVGITVHNPDPCERVSNTANFTVTVPQETATPTSTSTATVTETPTNTVEIPTETPTATATATETPTSTVEIPTETATATVTSTVSGTITVEPTNTATATPTETETPDAAATETPTATPTATTISDYYIYLPVILRDYSTGS